METNGSSFACVDEFKPAGAVFFKEENIGGQFLRQHA